MAIWANLVSALAALIKPLVLFLTYLGGKKAGEAEVLAEETKRNLDLQREYTENHTNDSTPDDTVGELRSGRF